MFKTIFTAVALFGFAFAYAQNGLISGSVLDGANHTPVEFATITLKQSADSLIVAGSISDSTGAFSITGVNPGNYFAVISFVGYSDLSLPAFTIGNNETKVLGELNLTASENALSEVVISGSKKVVETIPGGIVYNADQVLANASGTVMDMMKTVPNIIVDKDEHITIRGNSSINVMVDGVPTQMSGDDLTNFLKQLPSNMVSSVEVITTPGAKYDAAGSAGIINIKTKQNNTSGRNGSVNAGAGTLGSYDAGINLFSNSPKLKLNASYRYNHNVFESDAFGLRENYENPAPLYLYDEHFMQNGSADNHLAKIGGDYILNERNTVGGSFSYGNNGGAFNINDTLFSEYADGTVTGYYHSLLDYNYDGDQFSGNLHYNTKFGKGEELNFDGNFSDYSHVNTIPSETDFFDAAGNMIPGLNIKRNDLTNFGVVIYTGKIDYTLPLGEKSKFESGIKFTNTETQNDLTAQEYNLMSNEWDYDSSVSNTFNYMENVGAAYINYSGAFKKLNYTLGLRSELSHVKTASATTNANYDEQYIDLFPSANLKYPMKKGGEFSLDYSRRIDRPIYQWLNPFIDKSTPYTWFTGNPDLKPYYTNSFALNYTKFIAGKHYVMGSIFYQSMNDIFTQYFEYAGDGIYYLTIKNINNQTTAGASAMVQSSIAKWFDFMANLSLYQNSIDNELTGVDLDSKLSFNMYSSLTFKFWKNASFQLTGNYMSPTTNPQGYFNGFYSIDAGFKKSFIDDKLTVNLNVKDIFNSMEFSNEFIDETFHSDFTFKPVSRIASIALSWRFGDAVQNMAPDSKTEEENRINFGRQ